MADQAAVKTALRAIRIELPSWAFGHSGTRFKVFGQPGVPRTPFEKIDEAAWCTGSPGRRPRWPCTSRGTSSTPIRRSPRMPGKTGSGSAR